MRRNQLGARKLLLCLLGGCVCRISVLGCYPLVPACFAAFYTEQVGGVLLTGTMYIGMLLFMPVEAVVKYAVSLLVILGAVRLLAWAHESCPSYLVGILSALSTMLLSFCGSLLEWQRQPSLAAIILEGMFIFGATVFFNRFAHDLLLAGSREATREETKALPPSANLTGGEHAGRLYQYAETFEGLSRVFGAMSLQEKTDSDALGIAQREVTGKICASCESCALCWEQETSTVYDLLMELLRSVWQRGEPTAEVTHELAARCPKSRDMVEEATRIFGRISLNRAWHQRLLENRQVIAEQLDAMAYIMQDCAKEEQLLDEREKKALASLCYDAKECGIDVTKLHLVAMTDGRIRLSADLKSRMGGCIAQKSFRQAAERALHKKLRAGADARTYIGREPCTFVFYEDTTYRSVHGIARVKKDGAMISGDNFSFLELERGELLMGLSDGMGSGSRACKESEMVLDLVERFLEAGFSAEIALRIMNAAMVIKGEHDSYSTVDLCRINLYDGRLESYKIGAAATFIRHEGKVRVLASDNLPVGAELAPEITHQETTVENGDLIVMVTDGVLEYLHVKDPERTMCEMIESIETNNPGILCKRMMERVMLFTGGRVRDDMTVLAACIWEKNR